jgi:Ca-activated chloride channel family protein
MTFSDPRWLWGLATLPLLALLEWRALRRVPLRLAGLVGTRAPHALLVQPAPGRRRDSALCTLAALACLAIGAAGPEWGREVVRRAATGSDLVFVVDVSASMDSRDVPPSRLDEARREALAVLDRVEGSRVGVVAFAGDAVRLCPLTLDRGAARLTLESLSSGSVSEPGTDLARALRMAVRVMPGGRRQEQAILLWTDGEDLEQGARGIIDELERTGIRVFAVGVGTPSGDVVPMLDDQGRATDVKRDEHGMAVRSRLDEELLRTIAQRTHGVYFSASRPGGELQRLLSAVGGLARGAHGTRLSERPVARFPWFAGAAAALLVLDRVRARRRRARPDAAAPELHSERGAAAAILALAGAGLLLLSVSRVAVAQSAWARGDRALKAGRYGAADSLYTRRLAGHAPDEVRVNRATARALRDQAAGGSTPGAPGRPDPAPLDELRGLTVHDGRAGRAAGYNLGTLLGERRDFDPALGALRQVLERDPGDADARWNYELLMRRKREQANARQNPQPQQPQQRSGGGAGAGNPPPKPGPAGTAPPQPQPQPAAPTPGPPSPTMQRSGRMDREQAERLLGALQDLERLEQQRRRQVRVTRERRGRDW